MMLKPSRFTVLAMLTAITCTVNAAENNASEKAAAPDNAVVFTVNKAPITQARIDFRVKEVTQRGGQSDSPELRKAVRDDVITLEVLSQEAIKNGLDKQADVIQQLDLLKQTILANAFKLNYLNKHPIPEEKIKQEYDKLIALRGSKEYKISVIQVDAEKEAQAVLAELKKKGSKFDKIAKKLSTDVNSKDKGGDAGWQIAPNLPPSVLTLNKGEVSAPLQNPRGSWYIFKLEDVRDLKAPAYDDQIKANLERRLQQASFEEEIKTLRANADIK